MSIRIPGKFLDVAGLLLPTPYIRKIDVEDDGVKITLSLYLKISDDEPSSITDSMISKLSGKVNTYLYMTVRNERFNNIISGKNNVIEYVTQEEQIYVLRDRTTETISISDTLDPTDMYVKIDDIFQSVSDADGNTSYTYLVDKDVTASDETDGQSIWEFRIEKTISNRLDGTIGAEMDTSSIEGIYSNYLRENYYIYQILDTMGAKYQYRALPTSLDEQIEALSAVYDSTTLSRESSALEQSPVEYFYNQVMDSGLHVCAFSTSVDLNNDEEIDFVLNNKTLLATKIGDVSYETILNSLSPEFEDTLGNHTTFSELWEMIALPSQSRVEYITTSDDIYDKVALRTLGLTLHESNLREEIISEFDSMGLSTVSENRPEVEYMIQQINSILTNYADSEDLLPQLNDLRSYFPSKSSTTPVGKLYAEFKKKLYSLNAKLKNEAKLSKQVVRNPKLSDKRTKPIPDYDVPDYIDYATKGNEFIYPQWYVSTEYDDVNDVYTQYGFFFFDYEKALRKTAAISRIYNIDKLKAFGLDITYSSFYIQEASIWRMAPDDPSSVGAKITSYFNTDDPSYPKTTSIKAENFTMDSRNLQFLTPDSLDSGAVQTTAGAFGFASTGAAGTNYVFPMLVHRALSRTTDAPTMKTYEPATDTLLPADYRLMLFEFQDLYYEPMTDSSYSYYNTSFTIVDNTVRIVQLLESAYEEQMEGLNTYYEAASSWCSFNSITGEFNDFFIDAMEQLYGTIEDTAPWNTAATTYVMYRDLFFDSYNGDKDLMAEEIAALAGNLNPVSGNLEAIERLYQQMNDLYDVMWGPYGAGEIRDLSDSFSEERELVFESSMDSGEVSPPSSYWSDPWVTAPECNSDDDDYGQSGCDEMYPDNVGEYKCSSLNKCYEIASGGSDDTTGSGSGGSGTSGGSGGSGETGGSSKSGSDAEDAAVDEAEDGPSASTYGGSGGI